MDSLVELTNQRTGRKVFQYIDSEGKKGRIVSQKQHLLDLKAQGKLVNLNVDEITFSSKRKRSASLNAEESNTSDLKSPPNVIICPPNQTQPFHKIGDDHGGDLVSEREEGTQTLAREKVGNVHMDILTTRMEGGVLESGRMGVGDVHGNTVSSEGNLRAKSMVEMGRQPEASKEQQEEGRIATERLGTSTKQIILHRTSDVINQYLPPKTVNVVFCRPSPYQARVYTTMVEKLLGRVGNQPGLHLAAISSLKKICNAPCLVEDVPSLATGGPPTWEEQSGKLATVSCLLLQLVNSTQEKMVLVSHSTSTLDLLASLCEKYNILTCRLDGSTSPNTRQSLVDMFNHIQSDTRVFLLSSNAEGTGLNLIGASRLVLYDIDWNPATDMQAIARVWRDGQKKHCHVYRLLTTGTIEEKIYQRQVMKRGLNTVGQQATPSHFSTDELRDLFTLRDDTECETHDLLQCVCGGSGVVDREEVGQDEVMTFQLGREVVVQSTGGEELMGWRHFTAPVEDRVDDALLGVASQSVSFLLRRTEDSGTGRGIGHDGGPQGNQQERGVQGGSLACEMVGVDSDPDHWALDGQDDGYDRENPWFGYNSELEVQSPGGGSCDEAGLINSRVANQDEVILEDLEETDMVSVKVKNELSKKANAIESLKMSSGQSGMKEVCKSVNQFRAEESCRSFEIDEDLRRKIINILTDEDTDNSAIDFCAVLTSSQSIRDFFLNEIVQETLIFGSHKTVLKDFPPDLNENIWLRLVEEIKAFSPNLLSLLIKFCSKPNEPVTEKQVRKIIQLSSQLATCLNQKNSAVQKLVSLKLKLSSVTNAGLDFLHDIGITQSSRSLQRDNEYLASINRDYIVEELKDKSFSFLVDNLDKIVDGNLVNFTSVILIADRKTEIEHCPETEENFFDAKYLELDEICKKKYISAVTHILGHLLAKVCPAFEWIKTVLSSEYKHELSKHSDEQTFWSYIALLPLSEQKNSDMVEILEFLNEFTLEMLWKTADEPAVVKAWIDTIKDGETSDDEVELAEVKLMELAKTKGLPSMIGDQLTFERAFIAKKLRKGSITKIESFDLLQFRLAMFHELMAKVRRDFSTFLPNLTNTQDKGNLAYFRARLSKYEITNDGDKIKKDGNFEKHLDFFSSIAEESLKSALKEYFSHQETAPDDHNLPTLEKLLKEFMESKNIVLHWRSEPRKKPFDDLHKYHSRLVSSHLMNMIHKLFSKSGDGYGLRVVSRVATPYFLNFGGHRSKYAKYSFKDNVCHDSSSARQQQRNDLSTTVNAWGGAHSVDSDQFQEHRIKNIKGFLDNLHGNLDPTTIDKAIKSADLELKISAELDRSMNISYKSPGTSSKFLMDEEVSKVVKILNQIKPFSSEREPVVFVEPVVGSDNYSRVDSEPDLIAEFLNRNKEQYSTWGPFV